MTESLRTLLRTTADRLFQVAGADDLDEARLEVELLYARAANLDRVHVLAAGRETPAATPDNPDVATSLMRDEVMRKPECQC